MYISQDMILILSYLFYGIAMPSFQAIAVRVRPITKQQIMAYNPQLLGSPIMLNEN